MSISIEYMPITFDEIPVQKNFTIGQNTYAFLFQYNKTYDFFTMTIKDEDDNILYVTKLVYGSSLYHAVVENLELSQLLYAFYIDDLLTDKKLGYTAVNSDNLDNPVRIYLL